MTSYSLSLRDFLYSDTALPVPDWELIGEQIQREAPPTDHYEVWTDLARQWLTLTNEVFNNEYTMAETKHFVLLGWAADTPLAALGRFAELCRSELLSRLPGLANFDTPGKTPVLVFSGQDAYYTHIVDYHPDGEYGVSMGMHFRTRYAHVAMSRLWQLEPFPTLAHELTHAALHHLQMPLWLEEGLTQLFEHDVAGTPFILDPKQVGEQKAFWRSEGLEPFWSGTGFSSPGDLQKYSYQLAEILLRLLMFDYSPRWLGFDRSAVVRLMNFLREAHRDDAGAASAQKHLNLSLTDIAAKSLGR
jgi:hypothetical protein